MDNGSFKITVEVLRAVALRTRVLNAVKDLYLEYP
jgi:hypothetical protein